jgi:hypothetical protein
MNGPCLSVDTYLATCGFTNGHAKSLRGPLVAELLRTVPPDLRARVKVQTMQAAAAWTWPLATLTTALLTVEEREAKAAEKSAEVAHLRAMVMDEPSPMELLRAEVAELRAVLAGELQSDEPISLMAYVERLTHHLDAIQQPITE